MFEERPYEKDLRRALRSFNDTVREISKDLPMEIVVSGLLEVAAHHLNDLVDEDQWNVFWLGNLRLCDAMENTTCRVGAEGEHYLATMYRYDMRHTEDR